MPFLIFLSISFVGNNSETVKTLIQGGLGGAGFLTIQKTDETEELDVTGEDPEVRGVHFIVSQFTSRTCYINPEKNGHPIYEFYQ